MNDLGLSSRILRRDYLYGSLLAEGFTAFETCPADLLRQRGAKDKPPSINDAGGYLVADCSGKEHVVSIDGQPVVGAEDTGEIFDVVVIGGGLSGLAAAYYVQRETQGDTRVLIIENHDSFGGNSRRDEFLINGQTLYAPQASTVIQDLPPALAPSERASSLLHELGIDLLKIRVPEDQYFFGVFRDDNHTVAPVWYPNILAVPIQESTKAHLGAFFGSVMHFYDDDDWRARLNQLDRLTFRDYLRESGWSDEIYHLMLPELSVFFGFPDAVSAACVYAHYGTQSPRYIYGFPGGNSGLARYLVKALIPNALAGNSSSEILTGTLIGDAFDRSDNPTRLRVRCSAVRVEHAGNPDASPHVWVTVRNAGKSQRLRARSVIMACGGFVTRRILADMPSEQREAFEQFIYAPVLWANVALKNSRALDKAQLNLLSTYLDGFGGLLVRYEKIGQPRGDSERPNVIGVGCPRFYGGLSAREQEQRSQQDLMRTSFQEYEKHLRQDLARTLGPWGFDPEHDIAAIVLHRWAQHSYVFGYPGFFTSGVVERARKPFGRVAFAHTDLHKFSLVMGAVEQGCRAAREVCDSLGRRQAGAAD
jgi:spermidine dehydrogenase